MMRLLSRRIGQLTTTNDRPDLDHPSSSSIIDEHLRSISDQHIRSIFARIKVSFSPRSSAFSRLKPQQSLPLLLVERDLQLGIEQVPLVDNVALRNTPPIAELRSLFDSCDKKQIKQNKRATNYYRKRFLLSFYMQTGKSIPLARSTSPSTRLASNTSPERTRFRLINYHKISAPMSRL